VCRADNLSIREDLLDFPEIHSDIDFCSRGILTLAVSAKNLKHTETSTLDNETISRTLIHKTDLAHELFRVLLANFYLSSE
jgi:hypothetical protein